MDAFYTLFYCILFMNSKSLDQRETWTYIPFLRQFEFCTLSHAFCNFVIPLKRFPTDGILEGCREVDIWRSKIWAVWWVKKDIPSFCDCFLCFQTYVWSRPLQLKEHNSNISVRSNHPEMLLQDFKSWIVQVWVNGLTTWHMYQNHPLCIPPPQNSSRDSLCW